MKRRPKCGNYAKCWIKCQSKTQQYKDLPIEKWTHYQLLGYLISITNQKFEPLDNAMVEDTGYGENQPVNPKDHPMLEQMRNIYRHFHKSASESKTFLEWSLKKYGRKLEVRGLTSLLGFYAQQEAIPVALPDRTTPLSPQLKSLFADLSYPPATFGDLSFQFSIEELKHIIIQKLPNYQDYRLDKIQ